MEQPIVDTIRRQFCAYVRALQAFLDELKEEDLTLLLHIDQDIADAAQKAQADEMNVDREPVASSGTETVVKFRSREEVCCTGSILSALSTC